MGQPAATANHQIMGTDVHVLLIPPAAVPTPIPHPFMGLIDSGTCATVNIAGQPAAVVGSGASNTPPHIPQGGPFQTPPSNKASVQLGSATVFIGGQPAARMGDMAMTCNDPADLPMGTVQAAGTVMIG
jgi:uncharacterized Zn-binding protein involved in type VI secretion